MQRLALTRTSQIQGHQKGVMWSGDCRELHGWKSCSPGDIWKWGEWLTRWAVTHVNRRGRDWKSTVEAGWHWWGAAAALPDPQKRRAECWEMKWRLAGLLVKNQSLTSQWEKLVGINLSKQRRLVSCWRQPLVFLCDMFGFLPCFFA